MHPCIRCFVFCLAFFLLTLNSSAFGQQNKIATQSEKCLLKDCRLNEIPLDAMQQSTVILINKLVEATGGSPKGVDEVDGTKGTPVEILDSGSRVEDEDYAYKIVNGKKHEVTFSKDGEIKFLKVRLLNGKEKGKTGWVPKEFVGVMSNQIYRFSVGSISYISIKGLPLPSDFATVNLKDYVASWPARVCAGLLATMNTLPPDQIDDIARFRAGKQFRSIMWCEIRVEIDGSKDSVVGSSISNITLDPGYTPPADRSIVPPVVGLVDYLLNDKDFHAGELGAGSEFAMSKRHSNSAMQVSSKETVIGEGLIRFRAGEHTDALGIKAGSPYHVPWVWCGIVVTYAGKGEFQFHTQGSAFPSHKWFVDGKAISISQQKKVEMVPTEIVLASGVPVEPDDQLQVDKNLPVNGPVDRHKFTVEASKSNSTVIQIEAESTKDQKK